MFCSNECWNCNDKSCEHYIDKQDLYFKNKELKNKIFNAIIILKKVNVNMPSTLLIEIIDSAIDVLNRK